MISKFLIISVSLKKWFVHKKEERFKTMSILKLNKFKSFKYIEKCFTITIMHKNYTKI